MAKIIPIRHCLFFVFIAACCSLTSGCATLTLWGKERDPDKTKYTVSAETNQIYVVREKDGNKNDRFLEFCVPFRVKGGLKNTHFPDMEKGCLLIKGGKEQYVTPMENDPTCQIKIDRKQFLKSIFDSELRPSSICLVKQTSSGKNEVTLLLVNEDFLLSDKKIGFEKNEVAVPDNFGKNRPRLREIYPLIERKWVEKYGQESLLSSGIRDAIPVAWIDAAGNLTGTLPPNGPSGLLLAMKPNKFGVKHIRLSFNVFEYNYYFKGCGLPPYNQAISCYYLSSQKEATFVEECDVSDMEPLILQSEEIVLPMHFCLRNHDMVYQYSRTQRIVGTVPALIWDIVSLPFQLVVGYFLTGK